MFKKFQYIKVVLGAWIPEVSHLLHIDLSSKVSRWNQSLARVLITLSGVSPFKYIVLSEHWVFLGRSSNFRLGLNSAPFNSPFTPDAYDGLLTKITSTAAYAAVDLKISALLAFIKRLTVAAYINLNNYHPFLHTFAGLFGLLWGLQLRQSVIKHWK
jgi:hypothetical protein